MRVMHVNADKAINFEMVECGKTFQLAFGNSDGQVHLKIFNPIQMDNGRIFNSVNLERAVPTHIDHDIKVFVVDSELIVTHS